MGAEPRTGAIPFETHETPWTVVVGHRVRGGEEESEVHRGKVVADLMAPSIDGSSTTVYGFEVSEGLIPQGPNLFASREVRNETLRRLLEAEMTHRDWRDLVSATAAGNYVENDLPSNWQEMWTDSVGLEWLLGFNFVGDGDDFEIRCFETAIG